VLADVLARHVIEDVAVEDRPLEEVIAEFFAQQTSNEGEAQA
jgi:hypothetical protein